MLGFLSFIVVLTVMSGTVGLIAATIRNASGEIRSALRGETTRRDSAKNFRPRSVRQTIPDHKRVVPLRAAA